MCFNPKCPHCYTEIIIMDTVDIEYDEEMFTLKQVGKCPECGREYLWYQSAVLSQWANTDLTLI